MNKQQGPTRIEWTLLPVALYVTTGAEWNNVKPMSALIAQMMVVMTCWLAAVCARQLIRLHHSSAFDLVTHGTRSLGLNLCGWRSAHDLLSIFDAPALLAFGGQSIPATSINVKTCDGLPSLTAMTPFQSAVYLLKVFIKRYSNPFCRNFLDTFARSHIFTLRLILNGNKYIHSISILQPWREEFPAIKGAQDAAPSAQPQQLSLF